MFSAKIEVISSATVPFRWLAAKELFRVNLKNKLDHLNLDPDVRASIEVVLSDTVPPPGED